MKVFTVSELLRDAKTSLETVYPDVYVEGEISNLNAHSSGHCYFSLKDAGAQLSAVMFRDDFYRLRFKPTGGLQVILRGRLTLYPPQGRFQMVAQFMEPKGKGGLQLAFEQLKAKLQKEGLFDEARKRPIPALPQWVGVITSADGAALHDILTVLDRRHSGVRVLIHPAKVQGEGSAEEVAAAINRLNRQYPEIDVLLVGRGGGSLEDLWSFNEEVVARAIADSKIPIISCVGHETDFTIADFVADLRAPTPSAAAELVSQAKAELQTQVKSLLDRMTSTLHYRLDEWTQRLDHASSSRMLLQPERIVVERIETLKALNARLVQTVQNRMDHWDKDFRHAMEKLHLLSPLATLSRGYAIARRVLDHKVLKSAASVNAQDQIEVQLHEGKVYAQVERTEFRREPEKA